MTPVIQPSSPFNTIALGWALSATLVVLFVICLVAALVLPENWPATHRWAELFSLVPLRSLRVWIDGIVFSFVFGWISAVVLSLVLVYNSLIRRG